jgi:AcrR family transcriptional regulator
MGTVGASPRAGTGRLGCHASEVQRARILAAAVDTAEDVGFAAMSVERVVSRARVSRKTFYALFTDREDCFLAACEDAISQATALATDAYESERVWRDGIRAALASLLVFAEEEPGLARLLILESLAAGPKVLSRRGEVLDALARVIDSGRVADSPGYPPRSTGQAVVGGVLAVIHTHLSREHPDPVTSLLTSLMSMIVLPYLGVRAARRELERPRYPSPASGRPSRRASHTHPLDGLNMRVTYRSVRVLGAVAASPGASNREIAAASGISDQGQMSKLLARLAGLNLVENLGRGQEAGAPNAWRLTEVGDHLERTTRLR